MSELIITLSQGNLLGALVLTALGSIVLGMGLPTTAAYVVLAALGAPALGNSVMCAPDMIERPTASTDSCTAAAAIISGV
jgi:TRAP-type uncharacterized transport system fused permease subunit